MSRGTTTACVQILQVQQPQHVQRHAQHITAQLPQRATSRRNAPPPGLALCYDLARSTAVWRAARNLSASPARCIAATDQREISSRHAAPSCEIGVRVLLSQLGAGTGAPAPACAQIGIRWTASHSWSGLGEG